VFASLAPVFKISISQSSSQSGNVRHLKLLANLEGQWSAVTNLTMKWMA